MRRALQKWGSIILLPCLVASDFRVAPASSGFLHPRQVPSTRARFEEEALTLAFVSGVKSSFQKIVESKIWKRLGRWRDSGEPTIPEIAAGPKAGPKLLPVAGPGEIQVIMGRELQVGQDAELAPPEPIDEGRRAILETVKHAFAHRLSAPVLKALEREIPRIPLDRLAKDLGTFLRQGEILEPCLHAGNQFRVAATAVDDFLRETAHQAAQKYPRPVSESGLEKALVNLVEASNQWTSQAADSLRSQGFFGRIFAGSPDIEKADYLKAVERLERAPAATRPQGKALGRLCRLAAENSVDFPIYHQLWQVARPLRNMGIKFDSQGLGQEIAARMAAKDARWSVELRSAPREGIRHLRDSVIKDEIREAAQQALARAVRSRVLRKWRSEFARLKIPEAELNALAEDEWLIHELRQRTEGWMSKNEFDEIVDERAQHWTHDFYSRQKKALIERMKKAGADGGLRAWRWFDSAHEWWRTEFEDWGKDPEHYLPRAQKTILQDIYVDAVDAAMESYYGPKGDVVRQELERRIEEMSGDQLLKDARSRFELVKGWLDEIVAAGGAGVLAIGVARRTTRAQHPQPAAVTGYRGGTFIEALGIQDSTLYQVYSAAIDPIKEGLHYVVGLVQDMNPVPYADHVDAYSDKRGKTLRFLAIDPVGCLILSAFFMFLPAIEAHLGITPDPAFGISWQILRWIATATFLFAGTFDSGRDWHNLWRILRHQDDGLGRVTGYASVDSESNPELPLAPTFPLEGTWTPLSKAFTVFAYHLVLVPPYLTSTISCRFGWKEGDRVDYTDMTGRQRKPKTGINHIEFAAPAHPDYVLSLDLPGDHAQTQRLHMTLTDRRTGKEVLSDPVRCDHSIQRVPPIALHNYDTGRAFLDAASGIPVAPGDARAEGIRRWLSGYHASDATKQKARMKEAGGHTGSLQLPTGVQTGDTLVRVITDGGQPLRFALLDDLVHHDHFAALDFSARGIVRDSRTGGPLPTRISEDGARATLFAIDSPPLRAFFRNASRRLYAYPKAVGQGGFELRHESDPSRQRHVLGLSGARAYTIIKVGKATSVTATGASSGHSKRSAAVEIPEEEAMGYPVMVCNPSIEEREPMPEDIEELLASGDVRYLVVSAADAPPLLGYASDQGYRYYKRLVGVLGEEGQRTVVYRWLRPEDPEDKEVHLQARMVDDEHFVIDGVTWAAGPFDGDPVLLSGRIHIPLLVAKYADGRIISIDEKIIDAFRPGEEMSHMTTARAPRLDVEASGLRLVPGDKKPIFDPGVLGPEILDEMTRLAAMVSVPRQMARYARANAQASPSPSRGAYLSLWDELLREALAQALPGSLVVLGFGQGVDTPPDLISDPKLHPATLVDLEREALEPAVLRWLRTLGIPLPPEAMEVVAEDLSLLSAEFLATLDRVIDEAVTVQGLTQELVDLLERGQFRGRVIPIFRDHFDQLKEGNASLVVSGLTLRSLWHFVFSALVIKARTRGAELYESLSFRLAIYQWGLAVARRHIQSALALCRPGGLFLISTEIGYLIDWLLPPDLSVESFMRDLEAWTRSAPPHPLPVSIARLVVPEDQHLRAVQRASMSELDYSGSEFRLDMTPPAFTMAELGAQIVIQRLMTVLTADGDRSVFSVTLARKPLPKTGA